MTPEARRDLLRQFANFMGPARLFGYLEKTDLLWGFRRSPRLRRSLRRIYLAGYPVVALLLRRPRKIRFVEKTASNCFRLGYVNEVFPDARILYPTRHGYNNVNSLINGWLHPSRFFTYDVPLPLHIGGYPHDRWKFVLPPGWRSYTARPLEEVCAFQWRACHEAMLEETRKARYRGRVLRFKLEELARRPERWLRIIAEFVELPYDDHFRAVARDLPVINSPDGDTSEDKWRRQHREKIERVMPMIDPMLSRLGYREPP